jgi:hypothetical protein
MSIANRFPFCSLRHCPQPHVIDKKPQTDLCVPMAVCFQIANSCTRLRYNFKGLSWHRGWVGFSKNLRASFFNDDYGMSLSSAGSILLDSTFKLQGQKIPHSAYLAAHCAKNLKQIFPEMKLYGLVSNIYIHVSVSDLYIPTIGPLTHYSKIGGQIVGLYKSFTDT